EGLRFVEQVTGRLGYGRAALNGLLSGALVGFFIGLIFGLFSLVPVLLSFVLWGIVIGAVIGLIVGLIGYALTGGRRDFTSVGGMQAERYDVMVDNEVADEALNLLSGMP
ncbi:MAG TPA: glycine zipper family protein, partial [Trueperaceae bacterium]